MRKLAGLLIFSAGVAFAVLAFMPQQLGRDAALMQLTEIVAAPPGFFDAPEHADEAAAIRNFSPRFPLVAAAKPAAKSPPASAPTETASISPSSWQTVVTESSPSVPQGARLTSSKPGDSDARYELVLSLQRDLKRAGCYGGSLNGSWTASTRRAMAAFMESVNASLPVDEPDYILQTLVKGHATAGCGTQCPRGLERQDDGRCAVRAVVAQAQREPAPSVSARAAPAPASPSVAPPSNGFTTTVRVAETVRLPVHPAVPASSPASGPPSGMVPPEVVTASPGRMALGASARGNDSAEAPWRITLVPTPEAPKAPRPPVTTAPQVVSTQVAALPDVGDAGDDRDETGAEIDRTTEPSLTVGPRPGLPGTKSGRTPSRSRTAALAPPPSPSYAPDLPPRRVSVAPHPKPAAARQRAQRRIAYQTRSVRAIFSNPFGGR